MRYAILILVATLASARATGAEQQYTCNMGALTEQELTQYQELAGSLHSLVEETKELRNGFAFRLPADALVATSQWVSFERKCCPFFDFELKIEKNSGPIWLQITGDRGVKDFIRAEFEEVISASKR